MNWLDRKIDECTGRCYSEVNFMKDMNLKSGDGVIVHLLKEGYSCVCSIWPHSMSGFYVDSMVVSNTAFSSTTFATKNLITVRKLSAEENLGPLEGSLCKIIPAPSVASNLVLKLIMTPLKNEEVLIPVNTTHLNKLIVKELLGTYIAKGCSIRIKQLWKRRLLFRVVHTYSNEEYLFINSETRITLLDMDGCASRAPLLSSCSSLESNTLDPSLPAPSGFMSPTLASLPYFSAPFLPDMYLSSSSVSTSSLGGLTSIKENICKMILLPMLFARTNLKLDLSFPKGILLYGPPGVGKTLLVRNVIKECEEQTSLRLFVINGPDVISPGTGESERKLRQVFKDASSYADRNPKSIALIFIDELDSLCPHRESNELSSSRLVAQMLTLLDGLKSRGHVIVIGATNLPNKIDAALRRPGRFDREIHIPIPSSIDRLKILKIHSRNFTLEKSVNMKYIAEICIGYVGADLEALCREAAQCAFTRSRSDKKKDLLRCSKVGLAKGPSYLKNFNISMYKLILHEIPTVMDIAMAASISLSLKPVWYLQDTFTSMSRTLTEKLRSCKWSASATKYKSNGSDVTIEKLEERQTFISSESLSTSHNETACRDSAPNVKMCDFIDAMLKVGASSLRGVKSSIPTTTWEEIGGNQHVKQELRKAIEWPMLYRKTFQRFNIQSPKGILLYGPPGCSKTTLVRAAATASRATFLSLSAADLYSPFLGEAEAAVRQVFFQARAALPAVVFFDEIDSIVSKRSFGEGNTSGGATESRVLSTLLNEMDGVESSDGLLVVGATNRPDMLDAALLRPGRFDRLLYIPLPDENGRFEILKIHTKKMPLDQNVDLSIMSKKTIGFSGAELESLCREAAMYALRRNLEARIVLMEDFSAALQTITAASSSKAIRIYEEFGTKVLC